MGQFFFRAWAYIRYRIAARKAEATTPFAQSFIRDVLLGSRIHPDFEAINKLRNSLLQKSQLIESTDFGAGARNRDYTLRFMKISSIVKHSAVPAVDGELLYRLAAYFKPRTIIELGTSVGISTLYLAMGCRSASVITIEGCTTKSEQAATHFNQLNVENISQHIGRFDLVLPEILSSTGQVDLVFIDGNHTYEATRANFDLLLQIAQNNTVFVLDDIHWSAGMQKAWNEITDHEQVTLSIDLFRMGILFLRKDEPKQKLIARF